MPRLSTMSSHFYPEVSLIVASVPDDGRQAEVRAGSLEDPPLPDGTTPYIAALRAEREGEIRMVFRLASTIVEVPVEEIERAISFARQEVHAESFYPYPDEPDSAA